MSSMDDAKRDLIRAWMTKARHDLGTARKLAAGPDAYPDTAVYHCQQAAEKALKAYLVLNDHRFATTHDVRLLVQEAEAYESAFSSPADAADLLTPLATFYRYPGPVLEPSADEVDDALEAADRVFAFVTHNIPPAARP